MLNMIDAFSYASEYWEVGLWVKASNLAQIHGKTKIFACCMDGSQQFCMQRFPACTVRDLPCKGNLDMVLVHRKSQIQ